MRATDERSPSRQAACHTPLSPLIIGALSKHENIIISPECYGFLMYFGRGDADKTFQGLFGPYNWEEKQ